MAPNIEEFGPELKYIKVENNVAADALYCLDMNDNQDNLNISELYGYNDNNIINNAYPILYCDISKSQKSDAKLQQKIVPHKDYTLDTFRGDDQNPRLICRNRKICLPTKLQRKTVDCYHKMLCNPGETRIEHTIRQNFYWRGLRTTVHNVCKKCPTCQIARKLIINMASCHPNRMKQIPGTHYL